MTTGRLSPRFVEYVPAVLDDGVLYISMEFATESHLCACGCGNRVVTPFTPTDWRLVFDGESVSLLPSIGNWSFACRSHYWIKGNRIEWAATWSAARVKRARESDRIAAQARIVDPGFGEVPTAHDVAGPSLRSRIAGCFATWGRRDHG